MVKRCTQIILLILISVSVFSQQKIKIDLNSKKQKGKNLENVKSISNGFVISENISTIELTEIETKEGFYNQMLSEGMSKTFDAGKPDLPVINRLIQIPYNSDAKVRVISYDEEIVELKDYNLTELIIPAQPSVAKNKDIKDEPFIKDNAVYKKNDFFKNDLIKFEDKGYLRDKHLGYIEISPFAYNPVTNTLKVINNIEIEVLFIPKSNISAKSTDNLKSSYFESIALNTINEPEDSKAIITGPVKYVIVSDPMFKEALQPFIEWKTLKGFIVIEAYTDEIGTTTTDIKAYLKNLYDNPSDGISPTFILIVGDVAQIPTFSGTAGGHKTDLYYAEYTGDKLPEVFYGRFSAESIEELQPQIDKTLEIEKYEMPDPSYLKNVVLVAGVDGSYASKWGNGVINYSNNYYTNAENDITSYYYLYGDDSGVMASNNSGASASIRSYISAGVSFSNYSAHCGISGWSDPSFNISHIDGLTNEHMYPLIIGNCCESNTFYSDDCFGEELLMAPKKGAVGYIGGSNLTYWDEDYWWGVGLTSTISANPTYEGSGFGSYDRFFHLNGEAKEDWYITQGQINVAGNLAVESSTSSRKAYYWEIYHLMGDPSLTPFVSVPDLLTAEYNLEIITGSTSFTVMTEENAYVAVSKDGVLLNAQLVDATGNVELNFNPLTEVGILDLVITRQNRQPIIDKINIIPASTPYIVLDYYEIDDLLGNNNGEVDFGETIKLNVQLKNLSDTYDAFNVAAALSSADTNIIITDNSQAFGTILPSDSALVDASFKINFKNKFIDKYIVSLDLEITAEDQEGSIYAWDKKMSFTVNAPELEIGDLFIDDLSGNNNGILDPGETANISLIVKNNGSASISNLTGLAFILGTGEAYLTLNNAETEFFTIGANSTDTIIFNATANSETNSGTVIYMSFGIDDIYNGYYSKLESLELNIGPIPEILITDENSAVKDKSYFYDSGGSTANYTNYENDTITIISGFSGRSLKAEFLSFSVEPNGSGCYDYLKIYDGENTGAPLIGSYCNANIPKTIISTNEKGALTFTFYSDASVTQTGWKAEIRSIGDRYSLQLTVNDSEGPIENARVDFNGSIENTDINGVVNFYDIIEGINYPLKISATGFDDIDTKINVLENTTLDFTLKVSKYNVIFNLEDEDGEVDGDVTFDGITLSTENGTVTFKDVEYSLDVEYIIQSYGHHDSIASFAVTSDLSEDIMLNPIKYDVQFIISNGVDLIDNAVVEFDNKEILTENGIALFEQVKMDTMLYYIVRKTGFDNLEGYIDVEENSTVNLIMGSGTATFKVSLEVYGETNPIYNAQVILDQDTLYTNTKGSVVFENVWEAENIPYKITKEHFNDIVGTINVSGNNVVVDTNMTYKSYEIIFHINDGENLLEGAAVSFDGKSGLSDNNGECIFVVTYSLNKTYRISKEGYIDATGMINVNEDKGINVELSVKSYQVTFGVVDHSYFAVKDVLIEFNGATNYTDVDGNAVFYAVEPGENLKFTLSKEGFNNYDSSLNVINTDVIFNARLSSTTGIKSINENKVKIYPNPTNGIFNIEIAEAQNMNYYLKLFNVIGEIIYTDEISGKSSINEQIDISQKAKGMYFLSVESDNGTIISRRIILK